jgi:hypothetical protein
MASHKEHLACDNVTDIAKFSTLPLHSNFAIALDRNKLDLCSLASQMHAAWPQCLLLAATDFQLTLDPVLGFSL